MGQEPYPRITLPAGLRDLQATLEAEWPARRAAIPAWHPRNEDPPVDPPKDPAGDPPAGDPPAKPPWGSDDQFDPQRAWNLIQGVRGDLDKIKSERDQLRTKVQEHEDAGKDDRTKLEERATGAEQRAATAEAAAQRLEIALEKAPEGLSLAQVRKLAKRLSGDTREQLEADAEELFAEFAPNEGGGETRRRPQERLRPGAAPSSEPEETNPEKLAAQVPRMY